MHIYIPQYTKKRFKNLAKEVKQIVDHIRNDPGLRGLLHEPDNIENVVAFCLSPHIAQPVNVGVECYLVIEIDNADVFQCLLYGNGLDNEFVGKPGITEHLYFAGVLGNAFDRETGSKIFQAFKERRLRIIDEPKDEEL